MRLRGQLLPRWAFNNGFVRGRLLVNEQRDDELRRNVRVARFVDPSNVLRDLIAPLHDVVLVSCRPDWWTLTGYEVAIESTLGSTVHYRQSWILVPAQAAPATIPSGGAT